MTSILTTTVEEIGRVGYEALRIEEVAKRASVNKTTIYRRWPTKATLVTAAIEQMARRPIAPNTGALRSDLLAAAESLTTLVTSPFGKGILRLFHLDRVDPELEPVVSVYRAARVKKWNDIMLGAIARGELPPAADVRMLIEMVFAPLMLRVSMLHLTADLDYMARIIDVVIAGARATSDAGVRSTPPGEIDAG